ncbi:MAG TPA: glycoside hydrolase family 20 zincin-like fold domain-containing protein, partial [Chryseosolibacter sp.]|nr:glycoside hydrolase family 20 zincin-like fold domain-containing protein [Chryseosolibacter sp.]
MKTVLLKLLIVICVCASTHVFGQELSIIPEPVQMKRNAGTFIIDRTTVISVSKQPEVARVARYFNEKIKKASGFDLKISEGGSGNILLALNEKRDPKAGEEGYSLEVTTDRITVNANQAAGLFYGIQTLLQLL